MRMMMMMMRMIGILTKELIKGKKRWITDEQGVLE